MQPFPERMKIIRRIDLQPTGQVTFDTTEIGNIPAQLYRPLEGVQTSAREAPTPYNLRYRLRRHGSFILRYRAQSLGNTYPIVEPGDRVQLNAKDYEVLMAARHLSHGQRLIAYEAPVAAVADLYPLSAILLDNEITINPSVPVALIPAGADVNTDRGTYQDFDGEAPADLAPSLTPGRVLWIGPTRYRIRSSELVLGITRMSLRRAGG